MIFRVLKDKDNNEILFIEADNIEAVANKIANSLYIGDFTVLDDIEGNDRHFRSLPIFIDGNAMILLEEIKE